MDVRAANFEIVGITNEVIGEASLPDRTLEIQTVRKAAFDQVHDFGNCVVVRREEKVHVVRHDDEGMEFVMAFGAVVLQGFEEELSVAGDLEEAVTIGRDGRDEERAGSGGSLWDGHFGIVRQGYGSRVVFGFGGDRKGMRLRMPTTASQTRTRLRVI